MRGIELKYRTDVNSLVERIKRAAVEAAEHDLGDVAVVCAQAAAVIEQCTWTDLVLRDLPYSAESGDEGGAPKKKPKAHGVSSGDKKPAAAASTHRHDYDEAGKCKGCGAERKYKARASGNGAPAVPPVDPRQTQIPGAAPGVGEGS